MKTLTFLVTFVGVGAIWAIDRMTTTDLRAQIARARQENATLASLERERARLQRLHREADEHARRDEAVAELTRAQSERAAREQPALRQPPSILTAGEWLPATAWRNRGYATPTAAVETTLWAAAGGDVATLKDILQLDESVPARGGALLAGLPESSRAAYASAEHLIAAFTTKSIPLGDAQLVWQHQPGPDEAVACVFVKNSDANITSPSATPLPRGAPDKAPPMAPPSHKIIATYLSLRRTDDGWRLVVPMSAVEKIAKELGGSR